MLNNLRHSIEQYKSEWAGNLGGDIRGGISSGIITVPIALAFGQASGLGAIAGLYGAIILSFIGTLMGGTKTQISSPVGVILVAVIFIINFQLETSAKIINSDISSNETLGHALPYIFLTFFFAGLVQMILGFLRLGNYIKYLPYPVISGFSTGIGLLIIALQLQNLLEWQWQGHNAFDITHLTEKSFLIPLEKRLLLASLTIITIVIAPKVIRSIPSVLIAIIVVSIVPYAIGWNDIQTISIPEGVSFSPNISFIDVFSDYSGIIHCIGFGISLAFISSINTLLTSLAADSLTTDKHQSNKELIGQGLGNMLISIFGGMPGGGAVACTVNNIKQGGRTRLSGLISTLVLVVFLLISGLIFSKVPIPVLDGILIYIGYLIIDKKAIAQIRYMPAVDTIIMIIVAILTAYGELVYAVISGLSLASIYFMKKMADVVELDTKYAKVDRLVDSLIDTFEDPQKFRSQVYIKNIKGPVFFGFASRFSKAISNASHAKAVIFNMGNVPYVDQSGLYSLEREFIKLRQKNTRICLSELNPNIQKLLYNTSIIPDLISEEYIFPSVEECIVWLNEPGNLEGSKLSADKVYIPTAFTPNDDGANDAWMIKNISNYPNCEVSIYTREGEEVFRSIGYDVPWNGKFQGVLLPIDKYKYCIKLNGDKTDNLEGFVSIFR